MVNYLMLMCKIIFAIIYFVTNLFQQKFLEYEDANDQEKRALQGRKEALELAQKQMTLKVKNYADQGQYYGVQM